MKEIIESFFRERSLVNHQLASYDDCIPSGDNSLSRMEKIVRSIRVGTDEEVEDEKGGLIKLDVIDQDIIIRVKNIQLGEPTIREADGSDHPSQPMECRLRKLTYMSPVRMDFTIFKNGVPTQPEKGVQVGNMPIMVRSRRCNLHANHIAGDRVLHPTTSDEDRKMWEELLRQKGEDPLDPGGYFIINGTERVLISMEDLAPNRVTVEINKRYAKKTEVAKIFSQRDGMRKPLTVEKRRDGMLMVKISTAGTTAIPVVLLMRALGIENDQELFQAIAGPTETFKFIVANINEVKDNEEYTVDSMDEAHGWLEKKFAAGQQKEYREARVNQLLDRELLPHLGDQVEDRKKKAIFLGRIVRQVLEMAITSRKPNDKDHYANKRVRLAGDLVEDLFRVSMGQLARDLKYQLERHHNRKRELKITSCLRPDVLTSKIMHALATGNWGVKNTTIKIGVAQVLQRLSYLGTLSHLRRINTPIDKTTKMTKPRKLHPSTYGYICPAETPEGTSIGIVKNMALSCNITMDVSTSQIEKCIREFDTFQPIESNIPGSAIYINGTVIGTVDDMIKLSKHLIQLRRSGIIHTHTGIVPIYQDLELHIYTSGGRLVRPVFIVKNGNLVFNEKHIKFISENRHSWNELIVGNKDFEPAIEYLDVQESGCSMLCEHPNNVHKNPRYTHCEIDPSLLLGILASNIVFSNHNQSPRNTYQSAMGKQAMGIYATNFRYRMDMVSNTLWYPTQPVVMTHNSKHMNMRRIPNGSTVIIAVSSDKGYNQEDSLMFNKSSIDRGLFRSSFFRTYHVEERKNQSTGEEEQFAKPNPNNTLQLRHCSYDALSEDGFPIEGKYVKGGDAIVGKVVPMCNRKKQTTTVFDKEFRDNSTYIRNNEDGIVDTKYVSRNSDGYLFCKAKIRSERRPGIGDKFSSTCGQKGTIGMIYKAEDMPYSKDGVTPDIIMNPHAFPSRMTFGQLLESLLGIECIDKAMHGDGTPFTNISVDAIASRLEKSGYDKYGETELYSGETGKKLTTKIFMGPTFYQRLKHMVDDKFHARSTGPMVQMTRQPSEGRSRDGGLRMGEMERDCLLSHGVSQFQKEKFMELSDNFTVYTNSEGMMCSVNKKSNIVKSFTNKKTDDKGTISEHRIPYATKLFLHELQTMGIAARLQVIDENET